MPQAPRLPRGRAGLRVRDGPLTRHPGGGEAEGDRYRSQDHPPEVFDKRAVEKGQVRFYDVAYIEVTPRFDKDDPLKLAVQLTDFSVYYSQGLTEAIAADLKEGKSEVMCEQGKLIKVSKDKSGVITRDVLTRKWTD